MPTKESFTSNSKAGKSASTSSSRLASRQDRRTKGGVTWHEADPAKIQQLVGLVTENGALVSFSMTSDGGALVVFIKDGADSAKEYAASPEQADYVLDDLIDTYSTP